jgi:hypothetical protein
VRVAHAHKAATYLMVGAAFIAMTSGGGVSPLAWVVGAVGLPASWFCERPRIEHKGWHLGFTLASVCMLLYTGLSAIATTDVLTSSADLLIWLVVAKACNRRASRDWLQLYLLAFLMLVSGSVLNLDLIYGVCFLTFVLAATWALALFHLRRELEEQHAVAARGGTVASGASLEAALASRSVVDRRFFTTTGGVSLLLFVGTALFFLSIPRVGLGFMFKGRTGRSMIGFSEEVRLGGHGRIKDDKTVVMRATLPPALGGRSAPHVHWRGVSFDMYSRGQWSRSRKSLATSYRQEIVSTTKGRRIMNTPFTLGRETEELMQAGVLQDIWLDPLDSDVLFAAAQPLVFETGFPARNRSLPPQFNDDIRLPHSAAVHYQVWSNFDHPPVDQLRADSGAVPARLAGYLQLPVEITARTRDLARTITAGLDNNWDKAQAITDWLTGNLRYTLELEDPGAQEPVDFFLFDRKEGHCEYFASAFVILARAVGIHARNVNGFLGGEWNEYDRYVAVRAGDAHSWAEVYFPSHGWVTFDATPSAQADQLGRGGSGALDRLRRFMDTLRFQWSRWVIEYDLASQLGLFRDIGSALKGAGRALKASVASARTWLWGQGWLLAPLLLLVVAIAAWRLRRRSSSKKQRRDRAGRTPVGRIYLRLRQRLVAHGVPLQAAQTPREIAQRFSQDHHDAAPQLAQLTELYYAAEYGPSTPAAEEAAVAQARALADRTERALDGK